MPLGIEGSAADIRNGSYRAARLLLFKGGTKTVHTGVAVHAEGAGAASATASQYGKNKIGGTAISARTSFGKSYAILVRKRAAKERTLFD